MKIVRNILTLGALMFLCCCQNHNHQSSNNEIQDSLITVIADTIQQQQKIGIKMHKNGGVYEIPCVVNGLKMNFIFDTGASNVCISLTEALFMYKNGYITDEDLGEKSYSQVADGSIVANMQLNLRTIEIEGIVLNNVDAIVVASMEAPLLLGQSAIQRIGKIEMDGDSLFIEGVPSNVRSKAEKEISEVIYLLPTPTITWWDKVKAFFGNEKKINELLEAAKNAYENDMRELAIKYCEQAKALRSSNWKAYGYHGHMEFMYAEEYNEGWYINAINEYSEAVSLNKKRETFYFSNGDSINYEGCRNRLALSYALAKSKGMFTPYYEERALPYLQNLIIEQPNKIEAVRALTIYYIADKEYEVAEKWAGKLVALDEASGYFQLARIEHIREHYDKAIKYYEKVLELNPESGAAMNNLANSLIARDNKVQNGYVNINSINGVLKRPYYEFVDYNRAVELKKKAAKLGNRYAQNWLKEKGYDK